MKEKAFELYAQYLRDAECTRYEPVLLEKLHTPNVPRKSERIKILASEEFKQQMEEHLAVDPVTNYIYSHDIKAREEIQRSFNPLEEILTEIVSANPDISSEKMMKAYFKKMDEIAKKEENDRINQWNELKKEVDVNQLVKQAFDQIVNETIQQLENALLHCHRTSPCFMSDEFASLNSHNLEEFIEMFIYNLNDFTINDDELEDIIYSSIDYGSMQEAVIEKMAHRNQAIAKLKKTSCVYNEICTIIARNSLDISDMFDRLKQYFTRDKVLELFEKNGRFAGILQQIRKREQKEQDIADGILKNVPDNYIDLYPVARTIHRKFVLHIGPTNSGKTHAAMEALKSAGSGIYLGPLRLLAYEQYERLNEDGCLCSMVTGEEELIVEGATYQSSTIEMLPINKKYEVAVIDEAQMAGDLNRGGAWTTAILGVAANEVHVCLAPEAEKLVGNLIKMCGDECETVYHKRLTRLVQDSSQFNFPKSVQKGDALIVFSRKNVHAVAAAVQQTGMTCSIIYGALPYDVRRSQANLFANGKNDVVVATDAIGMGMNLPIRRVVFLEKDKYDGQMVRPLKPSEVKQIAGRAGRYGIYDIGYYTTGGGGRKAIFSAMDRKTPEVEQAVISFPEAMIGVEGNLSDIMEKWNNIPVQEGFMKADISEQIALCRIAEKYTDDKRLIYKFSTIPFDTKNEDLVSMWLDMLMAVIKDKKYSYNEHLLFVPDKNSATATDLHLLEQNYRICDLLFYYKTRFEPDRFAWVMDKKHKISMCIMAILDKQKLVQKKCKYCGKSLPWNYGYGMCQSCHDDMYSGFNRYEWCEY